MRQKSNIIKAGGPSRINGRYKRDTVKKKVPDNVYSGGRGSGRQSCRKDRRGGHTQKQKDAHPKMNRHGKPLGSTPGVTVRPHTHPGSAAVIPEEKCS